MHDEDLIRAIVERHGLRPERITAIAGGSVNKTFLVRVRRKQVVVRIPIDPLRPDEFESEAWCLTQAAAHGLPSPQPIARGQLGRVPYLIQTFVDGTSGTLLPSTAMWRTLAAYGQIVHSIPVTADAPDGLFTRFGRDLGSAWQAHLDYNLRQLSPTDPLISLGVYPADLRARISAGIGRLRDHDWAFGLSHGDLDPRNLLIPAVGPPVLVDWGCASAGPIPYGDLLSAVKAHRDTGSPSSADLSAFAADLGTPLDQISDTVEDLLLLDALDLVRWAIDRRPDRLDEVAAAARRHIEQLRD